MSVILTFKINPKSKAGKAFLDMVDAVYKKLPGIKILQVKELDNENWSSEWDSVSENDEILKLKKDIKSNFTRKAFTEKGIDYDSYKR